MEMKWKPDRVYSHLRNVIKKVDKLLSLYSDKENPQIVLPVGKRLFCLRSIRVLLYAEIIHQIKGQRVSTFYE